MGFGLFAVGLAYWFGCLIDFGCLVVWIVIACLLPVIVVAW